MAETIKDVSTIPKYLGKVVLLPNSTYLEVACSKYNTQTEVTLLIGTTYRFGYIKYEPVLSVTGITEHIITKWDNLEVISKAEFNQLFKKHLGLCKSIF